VTGYLLDVNVLLALSLPTHQHHGPATGWFSQGHEWATTPLTESAYVRLLTNPRVVGYEISAAQAIGALRTMRQTSGHTFLPDPSSLADPTVDLGPIAGTKQVTDFHLLNLAALSGLLLATFDESLSRSLGADRRHVQVLDR
jgi:toxin-antitoxin system PIN domain toxin